MISVKKSLSVLLAAAMLAASLPTVSAVEIAQAANPVVASEEDFTVRDDGKGGVEIIDYNGQGGDVIIPETIAGKKVTSIVSAFWGCESLTSIEIPNSVTAIGDNAFYGCESLTSIEIPNSVTAIGDKAFWDCESLTSIEIPNSVAAIGYAAFYGCRSLTSIEIPNGVTAIGDAAFYWCKSLTSIEIPNSVTAIGDTAFERCESLTSIKIPNSVTSIGSMAFAFCTSLTTIEIPSSLTTIEIPSSFTTISSGPFYGCLSLEKIHVDEENENYCSENGILFTKDKTVLIQYPSSKEGNAYDIPSSVTEISDGAFYNCRKLASIDIPNSVTTIGKGVFNLCFSLAEINVNEKNENYSSENGILFTKDKTALICYPLAKKDKTYVIPSSVTSIWGYAFYYCRSLTSIEIPSSVTSIWDYAFSNCTSLTSIEIPSSVKFMSNYAFSRCTSLTSIKIPNSVTLIGEGTFYNCESLTSIEIPNSVTTIGARVFDFCSPFLTIYGYESSFAETYAKKQSIKFMQLTDKIILDGTTGITVSNDELDLSDKTLSVSKTDWNKTSVTYDIELKDENGKAVQPEKPVTVKIPVPAGFDGSKCKVYRMEQDGTLTDMNASYENGCMVFVTSHFSKYKLCDLSVSLGDVNGDGKINSMDALWVLQAASGKRTLTDTQKAAADVNNDNKINSMDALWILQAASGKRTLS